MTPALRLAWFDAVHGNRLGLFVLKKELGWAQALRLGVKLQWRLNRQSPFAELNQQRAPTPQERLSQQQMAPVVVLYHLLRESGVSERACQALLQQLINTVAIRFLQFNVPVIRRHEFLRRTREEQERFLVRVTQRFFNAEAVLKTEGDRAFRFDVQRCHFARYCHELDVPQLANLFCQADRQFFDEHQPDVVFFRSQTLAKDQLPCDFRFEWREPV